MSSHADFAIDTSTRAGSIALLRDSQVLGRLRRATKPIFDPAFFRDLELLAIQGAVSHGQ